MDGSQTKKKRLLYISRDLPYQEMCVVAAADISPYSVSTVLS